MRDDELLAIYGATRQLAEGMNARDAELKKSTAALEAIIVQVHKLPAMHPAALPHSQPREHLPEQEIGVVSAENLAFEQNSHSATLPLYPSKVHDPEPLNHR
jgi:hypothetical protein